MKSLVGILLVLAILVCLAAPADAQVIGNRGGTNINIGGGGFGFGGGIGAFRSPFVSPFRFGGFGVSPFIGRSAFVAPVYAQPLIRQQFVQPVYVQPIVRQQVIQQYAVPQIQQQLVDPDCGCANVGQLRLRVRGY